MKYDDYDTHGMHYGILHTTYAVSVHHHMNPDKHTFEEHYTITHISTYSI